MIFRLLCAILLALCALVFALLVLEAHNAL